MIGKKYLFHIVTEQVIKAIKVNHKFIKTRSYILEAIKIRFKHYRACKKKLKYFQKPRKWS